jgi:hypothetical protein
MANEIIDGSIRTAKRKLPNDIKKKVEEWKFSSGALVMCLVAYSDGQDVQSFQFVFLSNLMLFISPNFQRRELPYCWEYIHQFLQRLEGRDIRKLQRMGCQAIRS